MWFDQTRGVRVSGPFPVNQNLRWYKYLGTQCWRFRNSNMDILERAMETIFRVDKKEYAKVSMNSMCAFTKMGKRTKAAAVHTRFKKTFTEWTGESALTEDEVQGNRLDHQHEQVKTSKPPLYVPSHVWEPLFAQIVAKRTSTRASRRGKRIGVPKTSSPGSTVRPHGCSDEDTGVPGHTTD